MKSINNIINGFSNIFDYFTFRGVLDILPFKWRMGYYDYIKPIFKPCHSKLRKSIPRQWQDITSLIVDVNFKFIEVFYDDEYKAGTVDWEATPHHKQFSEWLEKAYSYIKHERPKLQEEMDNSYPPSKPLDEMFKKVVKDGKVWYEMTDDEVPYEVKYKDVIRIEKIITDTDTQILTELINNREMFWT